MAILKKYDGTIEAQAAPGGGSVFTVSLPSVKTSNSKLLAAAGRAGR
jgi:signal transduction histidine kinase